MNDSTSIYLIGRRQGLYPFTNSRWFLENSRYKELTGLRNVPQLKIVNSIKKSDIIFIRNKPESTTDQQVKKIDSVIKDHRADKLVINDVKDFNNVDNKDITFNIWKNNDVRCPDYCVLNPLDIDESIEQITTMLSTKESILLRINNRTGGTAMKKINSNFANKDIVQLLEKLSTKVLDYRNARVHTNIIAVEHINNGNGNYTHAFRAHILNDEIISFYVAISKTLVVSMTKLEASDLNEFVRINTKFSDLMKNDVFKKKILKAMKSITNMGAVDFLLVDDEPIFLEINPMWKGNFFEKNFGDNKILLDWFYNKPELEETIPNVFQFKYPIKYWEKFYTTIVNKC